MQLGLERGLLSFSSKRYLTKLGEKQGAHVTAYRAFLEMLIASADGNNVRQVKELIVSLAKAIMPENAEVFDELLNELEKIEAASMTHDERVFFLDVISKANVSSVFGDDALLRRGVRVLNDEVANYADIALFEMLPEHERLAKLSVKQASMITRQSFAYL